MARPPATLFVKGGRRGDWWVAARDREEGRHVAAAKPSRGIEPTNHRGGTMATRGGQGEAGSRATASRVDEHENEGPLDTRGRNARYEYCNEQL